MKIISLLVIVTMISGVLSGCSTLNKTANTPVKVKYVDLSHRISNGTVTFPNFPAVEIKTLYSREDTFMANGSTDVSACELKEIKMLGINGTYVDAPSHVLEDGHTIADYPIEKLVNIYGVVVKMDSDKGYFDVKDIEGLDVKGKAVIFFSGHDKYFGKSQYGENVPYLTPELAKVLVEKGCAIVGVDTPLVDNMATLSNKGVPVHYTLLGADIPIIEDMTNLGELPEAGFTITAIPAAVEIESFPARVFATVTETEK